jgi:hypothetical protein
MVILNLLTALSLTIDVATKLLSVASVIRGAGLGSRQGPSGCTPHCTIMQLVEQPASVIGRLVF